ncbi:MAG: hypothetical protein WCQ95_10395 [Bacteroidota bacterium]
MEPTTDYTNQKEFLPEASSALTFSIWGNAISFLYIIPFLGFLACIAGIIISILGLIKGRRGMELWKTDKKRYHGGSFAKTLVAFILGIVGIVQGALLSLYGIFFTIMIMSNGFHHMF